MHKQKTKTPVVVSPKGIARYPYLNEPDTQYAARYNGIPEYKVQLIVGKEEGEKFAITLQDIYDDAYKAACLDAGKKLKKADLPWENVTDPETMEPTGEISFKFKLKSTGENKKTGKTWSNTFAWLNAKREPVSAPDEVVGAGSELKIAADCYTWQAPIGFGMTLRMKIVQLLDLKVYVPGGHLAEALFEVEEEGWEGVAGVPKPKEKPSLEDISGADF